MFLIHCSYASVGLATDLTDKIPVKWMYDYLVKSRLDSDNCDAHGELDGMRVNYGLNVPAGFDVLLVI